MEKRHLDRRLEQMESEGVRFRTNRDVGRDITGQSILQRYDAVVIAVGATQWRDLPVPGRELAGVHQAMEFLPLSNRVCEGDIDESPIDVKGRHVVIIGGGDTGADCLGTSHRQGAASVTQLEILPEPPEDRPSGQPWPTYPMIYRVTSAHEEGGDRVYAVSTQAFVDDGNGPGQGAAPHRGRHVQRPSRTDRRHRAGDPGGLRVPGDGIHGRRPGSWVDQFGLGLDARGNLIRNDDYSTDVPGVFVAGDAGRGQSLIVWAIAEGRAAAASVDAYLGSGSSNLPAPIPASARPLTV